MAPLQDLSVSVPSWPPGTAWIGGPFEAFDVAFDVVSEFVVGRCAADGGGPLAVVGDFVLPPVDGGSSRDFQTLHFDFGLPVDPKVTQDVARYTALYVPTDAGPTLAATRLVSVAGLLGQRAWPPKDDLLDRLVSYGRSHGAWDDARGYVEGSLARLVEAAAGLPLLPSVKTDPGFLCGTEFADLRSETEFFERHSLDVERVQAEVDISPGELLVFDNPAVAHGRRGVRRPGELRQRIYGERGATVARQRELRERLLAAFAGSPFEDGEPEEALTSMP